MHSILIPEFPYIDLHAYFEFLSVVSIARYPYNAFSCDNQGWGLDWITQ